MEYFLLVFSLLIILISAEIFTNGVEVFGERASLSQAVVGSVLAAVGTALPETIVPLVAILFYKGEAGSHIGIGAILGAPFMLATLGFFLVGVGAFISFLRKKRGFEIFLEEKTFKRDFFFFLLSYSLAIGTGVFFSQTKSIHYLLALGLVFIYLIYLRLTFRAESLEVEAHKDLYLSSILKKIKKSLSKRTEKNLSLLQAFMALLIMVKGAHLFVENLEKISFALGLNPLIFSLLLAPVATELPEKFNSLLWSLRNRDILALGNISGAMVFQSTFPVSVGLIFTPWEISGLALYSALIALGIIIIYYLYLMLFKRLPLPLLLLSGLAYLGYFFVVLAQLSHGRA